MSMTDPIADMLTRIRNATKVRKKTVDVPYSKVKKAVADVLKREGYIADFQVAEEGGRGLMRLDLKYNQLGESVIQAIERESKPGRRVYRGVTELEPVLRGIGISVISTPKGILSDRECRQQKIGGEVICSIW